MNSARQTAGSKEILSHDSIIIMTFLEDVLILSLVLLLILIILYSRQRNRNGQLLLQLQELISRKQSLSTKYGKMTEQFMPFMENYPYSPEGFRFIGSPIDGVQFEKDKIIFIEFKAGNHAMTSLQKEIRDLIIKGKIEFREIRIK